MIRRTFGSIKEELRRVAGQTGMNTSDPRVMAYANMAIEELMNEGDWPSIIDRLRFKITQSRFVLPSDYDRMLYCTIDGVTRQMQSPWYEFVGTGLELLNLGAPPSFNAIENRFEGVLDRDTAATFEPVPSEGTTYYPRVYGTVNEKVDGIRPDIIIQGYDVNNNWIRSSDGAGGFMDGVAIPINGDAAPFYLQSTQSISVVTAIIKPVTKGNVLLYAASADGSKQTYIGQYAPKDTTPFYREYSLPGLRFDNVRERCVIARCRHRYVPITTDNDFVLITNLPALRAMFMAVYRLEAGDTDSYAKYKLTAIDLMKKEAKAYVGLSNQKPLLTISEGMAMRGDAMYIL